MANTVIGIGASPRKTSNSGIILEKILEGVASQGAQVETILLRDLTFSSCIGCELCRAEGVCEGLDDDLNPVLERLESARGLVLSTPVHTYNVTALMKAFIDRLYRFYDFTDTRPRNWSSRLAGQERRAVLSVVFEQPDRDSLGVTMEAMRAPVQSHGYGIVGEILANPYFDAGAVTDNRTLLQKARDMGAGLARALEEAK